MTAPSTTDIIDQIRRINLAQVVQEWTQVSLSKMLPFCRRQTGTCPFCKAEQFTIWHDSDAERFHCMACKRQGDIFDIAMTHFDLTFPECYLYLATHYLPGTPI